MWIHNYWQNLEAVEDLFSNPCCYNHSPKRNQNKIKNKTKLKTGNRENPDSIQGPGLPPEWQIKWAKKNKILEQEMEEMQSNNGTISVVTDF